LDGILLVAHDILPRSSGANKLIHELNKIICHRLDLQKRPASDVFSNIDKRNSIPKPSRCNHPVQDKVICTAKGNNYISLFALKLYNNL